MKTYQPALLLAAVASLVPGVCAQTITGLGRLGDSGYAWATAVSDDGVFVAGSSNTPDRTTHAFRWTQASGLVDLGVPTGQDFSVAYAVSNEGSVIVGWTGTSTSYSALRWTQSGGMVALGSLPGDNNSLATGVSADGLVTVGYSYNNDESHSRAFWWNASRGFTPLPLVPGGTYAFAEAISRDGSVIVGYGDTPGGDTVTILWTGNEWLTVTTIPQPTFASPRTVSSDGSVIVAGNGHVIRWDASQGTQDLGAYTSWPGPNFGLSTNSRGTLIGGCVGTPLDADMALVWTPSRGLVDARSFFTSAGIDMTAWYPSALFSISPDGRTIAGSAWHVLGENNAPLEAFVATLPACGSADFNGDGDTGTDSDIEAFFACLGGTCCSTCDYHGADFNGDGDTGTDADIEAFFRVLGGSSC